MGKKIRNVDGRLLSRCVHEMEGMFRGAVECWRCWDTRRLQWCFMLIVWRVVKVIPKDGMVRCIIGEMLRKRSRLFHRSFHVLYRKV